VYTSYRIREVEYCCPNPDAVAARLKKAQFLSLPKIDRSILGNLSISHTRARTRGDSGEGSAPKADCVTVPFDPDLYPHLTALGFGPGQLAQIRETWTQRELDLNGLPEALDRAEWMAAHPEECLKGVDRPLGYIFRSLKNGIPSPPPGYLSRKERVAKELRKQAERIRELEKQHFEDSFLVWWHSLSDDERRQIDSTNKTRAMWDVHRREYYRQHVYKPL
ncbi:hypothetical protein SAMN02746041_03264, partial [Desulfacinum hydrothermale DSM 13146]